MKKTRFFALLMSVISALSISPIHALEQNERMTLEQEIIIEKSGTTNVTETDFNYYTADGCVYFDESTGTITGADVSITSADIPSFINGVAVTSINIYAFMNCEVLTSVTIPSTVNFIGEGVFLGCTNLTDVYFDGYESEWNLISISDNSNLSIATIHYKTTQETATASPVNFTVNDKTVNVGAYLINQNNYIKIRDLASIINSTDKNFDVSWNNLNKCIEIIEKTAYTSVGGELETDILSSQSATLNTNYPVYFNGQLVNLTSYVIGQNTYLKLRDVMKLVDVYVGWDFNSQTAVIDTTSSYEN